MSVYPRPRTEIWETLLERLLKGAEHTSRAYDGIRAYPAATNKSAQPTPERTGYLQADPDIESAFQEDAGGRPIRHGALQKRGSGQAKIGSTCSPNGKLAVTEGF